MAGQRFPAEQQLASWNLQTCVDMIFDLFVVPREDWDASPVLELPPGRKDL